MRALAVCGGLLVAFVFEFATPATAGAAAPAWVGHYRRARQASQARDWSRAIEHLTQAIESRPDPALQLQIGQQRLDYLPYLELGIAFYNSGQYAAALDAFALEESFEAVNGAPSDLQNLRTFRTLAREAQTRHAESGERFASVVARALEDAETLQWQGRIEDAIAAAGRALALDPHNRDAADRVTRLRRELAEQQQTRERERRWTTLVDEAQRLAARGDHEEAASGFRQALDLSFD